MRSKIKVSAAVTSEYEAEIATNFDSVLDKIFDKALVSDSQLVFVDNKLPRQWTEKLLSKIDASNASCLVFDVASDEENKNVNKAREIVSILDNNSVKRRSNPPIVIGGGVCCDVVGFACSVYRRGIPYIRVPTSLLGMVDVSVAAKTGINFQGFRNRIGSFHPASQTIICPEFLDTLPARHVVNGLGEIIKLAIILSADLFSLLETAAQEVDKNSTISRGLMDELIFLSAEIMAKELETNLWEKDLKRAVDYGHSVSPAVEMQFIDEILHGEVVAIESLLCAQISANRDMLRQDSVGRVVAVANSLGLPTYHRGFESQTLMSKAITDTMTHRDGSQNIPLPTSIGEYQFVNDLNANEVAKAARQVATLSCV